MEAERRVRISQAQVSAVFVREPADSSESVGNGAGMRVYVAHELNRHWAIAPYALAIRGTKGSTGEAGVQLVYSPFGWR